ncbi:MAG: (Fe-S)-binding protein, partial [Anaerolineae bacterium]
QIETLPQVQSVHHIHTWSLDGEHHVFSAHLVVDADATRSEAAALKQQVRTMLNGHEFEHTAVVEQLGLEAEISRVDDPFTIAQMGIFTLPQLMIDGQLVRFRYHGRRSIEELDGLVQLVNRTWERRQELTPSYQKRQHPTPMAVFQLLPKTNCKQCGEETCYIFALKLSVGQRQLADCPLLIEPNYVDKRRQLEEIVIDAPAIG